MALPGSNEHWSICSDAVAPCNVVPSRPALYGIYLMLAVALPQRKSVNKECEDAPFFKG